MFVTFGEYRDYDGPRQCIGAVSVNRDHVLRVRSPFRGYCRLDMTDGGSILVAGTLDEVRCKLSIAVPVVVYPNCNY